MRPANTAGGVMGKMIAAPSIVCFKQVPRQYGQEGAILRFVFRHSLGLACLAGAVV